MCKQNPALDQHWAVVLKMDLGQEGSIRRVIRAVFIRWQVENLLTPIALAIRDCMGTKFVQQRRHNHWGPDAALRVHGFDVFAKNRWMMLASTEQTVLPQEMSKCFIRP